MANKQEDLGNAKISSLLITLSFPSMLAMFANAIYNIVDTIFVGRGIGSLGIGTATLMSRRLGAGKEEEVNQIVGNGMFMIILAGIFFSIVGGIFTNDILRAFGATDGILPVSFLLECSGFPFV